MKRFLFLVVIILVLVGLGGAGYVFFGSDASPASENGAEESPGRSFFPLFGGSVPPPVLESVTTSDGDDTREFFVPLARRVSGTPVAGARFVRKNGTDTLRYVDRATGNIFEADATSTGITRLTNTTVSGVQEAVWLADNRVALRYLRDDTLETFLGAFTASTTVSALSGSFLPVGVSQIAVNRDGSEAFYLALDESGARGVARNLAQGGETTVFRSPLAEWLLEWGRGRIITLATKPSASIAGHLFFLDRQTGEMSDSALGGVFGLTARTSPDAKKILYASGASLFVSDIETGETTPLSVATLPEKCVWSETDPSVVYCGVPAVLPRAQLPDEWYQGVVVFHDSLWRLDVATGESEEIVRAGAFGAEAPDITHPILNADETLLAFINKTDDTLWVVKVE